MFVVFRFILKHILKSSYTAVRMKNIHSQLIITCQVWTYKVLINCSALLDYLSGRRGGEHPSRMWDNAPLAAFLVEHFAVLSNSEYNVYSLRLESTAIRLMSFSCIELLVATLVNVASGWTSWQWRSITVRPARFASLRWTYFYRRFLCLSVSIRSCLWNETWALLVFDYPGQFLAFLM